MNLSLARRHTDLVINRKKLFSAEELWAYLFVGIPLLGYLVFNIFPLAISFVMQFSTIENNDISTIKLIGFSNFSKVFSDKNFYLSLGVTLLLSTNQLISLGVALFISILLSKKPWGHKVFQIIYFIPYICSSVAVSMMWQWMFNPDYGIINSIISALGGTKVSWFSEVGAFPWMIIIACVWQAPGYGIVMYKAALNAVNPSLYEAADIDGASAFKKLIHVTLPAIAPTTFFLLMAGIINGLQIFDMAKMFTDGNWLSTKGPENIGLTTVLYIYTTGTDYHDMPSASVMSWSLFCVIFVISLINYRLRRKWVDQ